MNDRTALHGVRIHAPDLVSASRVYAAITKTGCQMEAQQCHIPVGDATIRLTSGMPPVPITGRRTELVGIWGLDLGVADPQARLTACEKAGFVTQQSANGFSTDLNGVRVFFGPLSAKTETTAAQVKLDHVALLVKDLARATRQWELLTGLTAHYMAIHPVSQGTLSAARFALGPRMIELLSPIVGTESALRDRLHKVGEGPMALALPAHDLEATLAALRTANIGTAYREPHWVVRPSVAIVPIQLTPRVGH